MRANGEVASFPLIEPGISALAGLITVMRRLSTACSKPEIMRVVTQAARALLQADGVTFVLRDGDRCHYAEEDATPSCGRGSASP